MPVSYDQHHLPSCCGIGLIPGEPYTVCQVCRTRFDTRHISDEIMLRRCTEAAAHGKMTFSTVRQLDAKL